MTGKRRGPAWVCLALGLLVAGPLLTGRGFALVGDMVFVPHQPWKDQWLGADGGVPRAVPGDAIVSALTTVVPGDLLQKAVLLLVAAAGWGMLRLLGDRRPWPGWAGPWCSRGTLTSTSGSRSGTGLCCAATRAAVGRRGRDRRTSTRNLRPRLAVLVVPLAVAAWTARPGACWRPGWRWRWCSLRSGRPVSCSASVRQPALAAAGGAQRHRDRRGPGRRGVRGPRRHPVRGGRVAPDPRRDVEGLRRP